MTREEIIEGLKLLEDNMVYFDELLNDKGEYIDVHELLFEAIEVLEQEPCEDCDYKEWLKGEAEPKTDVLDKIRAEIEQAVWEDVVVSLDGTDETKIPRLDPDDVFEIIDKYKAEKE